MSRLCLYPVVFSILSGRCCTFKLQYMRDNVNNKVCVLLTFA